MSGRSPRWFTGIKYPYESVFANNTWEQIIEACQLRRVPASWAVGDQKAMTIDGTDYPIDIIGFNHDDYSDGSGKAPITFQMHDCYYDRKYMHTSSTNKVGWVDSNMRLTRLPEIFVLMPPEVQSAIRAVTKLTSEGGKSSVIETTDDGLFLLSEVEVTGNFSRSFEGEGTQYTYYAMGNSASKIRNGHSSDWWLRSPNKSSTTYYVIIATSGVSANSSADVSRGVCFAFCF